MAYGRLDVFWPDGKYETFPLTTLSVSVGRSAGCTIVLDTDTISRYHFSITHEGSQVTVSDMDSANGTFVDGVRLNTHEARPLLGGEELQIGHLRLIYHHAGDQGATQVSEIVEDTQRFERPEVGFHIEVYGPEFAVPPGSHTSIELSISNNTDKDQRYVIKTSGLPSGWARTNRPEVTIDANEGAPVLINIKPLRRSDSAPGDYPFQITVYPKNEPAKKIDAEVIVRILPYSGFGMALASNHLRANEPFRLHLHNQGSIGLPLYIMGRSKDDALEFGITQPQVILSPGERQVFQGGVHPRRRRIIGSPREQSFDVLVRSRDDAAFLAALRAYYMDTPLLPSWVAGIFAILILVGLIFVAGVIGAALRAVKPQPEILSFSVNNEQVNRGDRIIANWSVRDAENITLLVNDAPLETDIAPSVTSIEIPSDSYNGLITIALDIANGELRDRAAINVTVIDPLVVEYFEILPSVLVRNVVSEVNVRWRVVGANTTRVLGLESLGNIFVDPSYGAEGSFTVAGVATDSFIVTLYAESEGGYTLEQSLDVDTINAECTTLADNFTLYAAPDMNANVVSTVPGDTTLVVDGRDVTGAWLQVRLPGVEAWGARTGVECADTFTVESLVITGVDGQSSLETTPDLPTVTPPAATSTTLPQLNAPSATATKAQAP